MRTTIKDIAAACGVSTATVSLALAGKTDRVSKSTIEKVQRIAQEMKYYPNAMASNLARGRSQTIGLVLNDIRNAHIADLYMAINAVLRERGYTPVCHILSDENLETQTELIREIATENLCALIWAKPYEPGNNASNQQAYDMLDPLGIPIFTMDAYEFRSPGINICFDYRKAAYIAVHFLIESGHRKIGCISGNPEFNVTQERILGYKDALEEAGIAFDEKLIYKGDYTMPSGSLALPYLKGQGVTGIFAMNDEMAFGVYKQARIYGAAIPDDISVIGCDNVPYDEILEVPLSTVGVPAAKMGRFMADRICNAIELASKEGVEALGERETVYYEPDLYLRGSVKNINN